MAVPRDLAEVLDRTPPQSVELEMCVLGGIMLEPREAYAIAADYLSQDSFYLDGHALIFRLMGELFARGIPPDAVALIDELRARGLLEKVGGTGVVMGMLNSVPTAANVEQHARKVADKARARDLIRTCTQIVDEAYRQELPVEELLQRAAERTSRLADSGVADDVLSLGESLQYYMQDLSARDAEVQRILATGKKPGLMRGLSTGFPDLDRMLRGLRSKQLVIIAARPSQGKSTLALNIACHVAQSNPVVLFSLEMSHEELDERILAMGSQYIIPGSGMLACISANRLDAAEFSSAEWGVIGKSYEQAVRLSVHICDKGTLRLNELRARVGSLVRKHGVRLVIVDYLQLMTPGLDVEHAGLTAQVTSYANGLKCLAQDFGIPVIAVSQLSRANEREGNRKPRMSDLRESGTIEQAANIAMFLWKRTSEEEDHAAAPGSLVDVELLILKNRNGPCGRVNLRWNKPAFRFLNATR